MRPRVLVVEDEPGFGEVLSELLTLEGYSARHVRNGSTALDLVASQEPAPQLILCDVMLPGLRGDRLAAEIRRRWPKLRLPILLMSASNDPRVRLRDVEFLPKPFDSGDLLSRLRGMLTRAAAAAT